MAAAWVDNVKMSVKLKTANDDRVMVPEFTIQEEADKASSSRVQGVFE
jgi:hypothetical protein